MNDPRVPSNFTGLPTETQISMIDAYQNEQNSISGPQIFNIFKPTNFSNSTSGVNITSGQFWAAAKVGGGLALIAGGALTLPEGAPLIALGIPTVADGGASALVEFVLGGDTSAVPPTMNHAAILVIEGAADAYTNKSKDCE